MLKFPLAELWKIDIGFMSRMIIDVRERNMKLCYIFWKNCCKFRVKQVGEKIFSVLLCLSDRGNVAFVGL